MLYECDVCGHITNNTFMFQSHKCINTYNIAIENLKRGLMRIDIYPKRGYWK